MKNYILCSLPKWSASADTFKYLVASLVWFLADSLASFLKFCCYIGVCNPNPTIQRFLIICHVSAGIRLNCFPQLVGSQDYAVSTLNNKLFLCLSFDMAFFDTMVDYMGVCNDEDGPRIASTSAIALCN